MESNLTQTKTGLLIIDVQNDYFEGGAYELKKAKEASIKASLMLNLFRKKGSPIFHIQHISNGPDATFFLPNTFGVQIHSNVSPLELEKVIVKHYPNSFRDTELLKSLKEQNITDLVIIGMMTHMCVDATTRAAKDFGFNCTVIGDACATRELVIDDHTISADNVHYSFLAALSFFYATITDCESYIETKFSE